MSLGSEIQTAHAETTISRVGYHIIYVADFTERTKRLPVKRHVEITSNQQLDPNDATGATLMDSLIIHNKKNYQIEFVMLNDNVFTNIVTNRKHTDEHCEGCFSLFGVSSPQWVAFMELKDCSSGSQYKAKHAFKAKRQIYNVIKDLRARGIISTEKLFGIISWPQIKTSFDSDINGDIFSATRIKKYTGVTYYGTNEAYITDEKLIRPVL